MEADVDLAWGDPERGGSNRRREMGMSPSIQGHLGPESAGGGGEFQNKKKVLLLRSIYSPEMVA